MTGDGKPLKYAGDGDWIHKKKGPTYPKKQYKTIQDRAIGWPVLPNVPLAKRDEGSDPDTYGAVGPEEEGKLVL